VDYYIQTMYRTEQQSNNFNLNNIQHEFLMMREALLI